MTARVSMSLKSRASLIFFRACFVSFWVKDLLAPRCVCIYVCMHVYIYIYIYIYICIRSKRFSSSPEHPCRLWGPPSPLCSAYQSSSPVSSGRGVKSTTLLHVVPRLRIEWSCTSTSPILLHGVDRETFLLCHDVFTVVYTECAYVGFVNKTLCTAQNGQRVDKRGVVRDKTV